MTEIPEHLLRRANAARAKAAAEGGEAAPYIPAHLLARAQAARAKAGETASPIATTQAQEYVAYQDRLQVAISKRQESFPGQHITQLVLESFQGSLVVGASRRRFKNTFDSRQAWDYLAPIPSKARSDFSDFGLRFSTHTSPFGGGNDIESGALATLRAWSILAGSEKRVLPPVPDNLQTRLVVKAAGHLGLRGGARAARDKTMAYELIDRADRFVVPPAFDAAITSFDDLLDAYDNSDEWDLNHWQGTGGSIADRLDAPSSIYNPRAFVAGARLIASLIEA